MSDEENREKEINLGRKKKEIQEAGDLYKADLGIYKDVAVFFFFWSNKDVAVTVCVSCYHACPTLPYVISNQR